MLKIIIFLTITFILSACRAEDKIEVNSQSIFVSIDGNDNNDGRTEDSSFRTIKKAAIVAVAGETIYVKAGVYEKELIEFKNSGQENEPITIEGYKNRPGDRPIYHNFDYKSDFNSSIMPILDGLDREIEEAIAIGMYGKYQVVRNLQIRNYSHGVYAYNAQNAKIYNLYVSSLGSALRESYSGYGIIIGENANNCLVKDSVVVNAGAEALMLYGSNNKISNCYVYGASYSKSGGKDNNPTDYYMNISGNSNIITDSKVVRVGKQLHVGHGIGIKGDGKNNIIKNNTAIGFDGESFYARHRGAKNNLFQNNIAKDGKGSGIEFRDGASFNIVEGHKTVNMQYAIMFKDSDEDGGNQFTGNDNIIRNSTFLNSKYVIYLSDAFYTDSYTRRNIFKNLTIDGASYLFGFYSYGEDNILSNSQISNISKYADYGYEYLKKNRAFLIR